MILFIIIVLICHFVIIPGIEMVWYTAISQASFKAVLEKYIEKDTKFAQSSFSDIYLTAWDIRNRKPAMMTVETMKPDSIANLSNYDDFLTAT